MTHAAVRLRHGLWSDDRCHRELRLRRPDPATLAQSSREDAPCATWATALLAACVEPVGERDARATAAALVVGDHAAALWALHALVEGGPPDVSVACPGCGEALDVDVDPTAMAEAAAEGPDAGPWFDAATPDGEPVRFRLPTAGDLEAVAAQDPSPRALLERIVAPPHPDGLPDLEDLLADRIADLDPLAEVTVQTVCPSCGGDVAATLDPVRDAHAAVARAADAVEWEVHTLASHYHWSEQAILELPPARRARYIELVTRDVGA